MNQKTSSPLFFITVLLIACLTSVATDLYAPSLPHIARVMHASIEHTQFSLSVFLIGVAISQLVYGPISEGVGRKIPLIAGLLIFLCGSLLSILANHIEFLVLGRFVQGLGAGACSALWRSIFRDAYQGNDLSKYGAWLSVVVTFFMPAVPVLGGYFQKYHGWQVNFGFLMVYSLGLLWLILYRLEETSQHHHLERLKSSFILQAFKQLCMSPIFMGYALSVFFCYGAFFSWLTIGPVLLMQYIGLSPVEFGWISFFVAAIAMGLAGVINGKVVNRMGGLSMLRLGWILMFASGWLLLIGYEIWGLNLYVVMLPVFLFYFGVTFIWPNAFAGAFTPFGEIAGYAGSLYGFIQLGGGALIGSLVAWLPVNSPLPLAGIFIFSPVLAWVSYTILVNKQNKV